jgi:DNA polymerase
VALGATAAAALFGAAFHVTAHRGEILPWLPATGPFATGRSPTAAALATIHPSAVLRAGSDRDEMYRGFVDDLGLAAAQATTGAR